MKRSLRIAFMVFLFLGISLGRADNSMAPAWKTQAQIEADPNFYVFGDAKEGDILKHTFMFKNNEDVAVNIKEVNTSCACTTSKIGTSIVRPGEAVPVEICFDTKGSRGLRKRQIFIHTDSKKNPLVIFEIQANIK